MKMNLLRAAVAATAIVGLSGAALAQATGPTPQDNTKMKKDMSKGHMSKGGMKAGNTMAPATSGANTTGPAAQKSMTAPAEPKAK
jgi:hypothetical protein